MGKQKCGKAAVRAISRPFAGKEIPVEVKSRQNFSSYEGLPVIAASPSPIAILRSQLRQRDDDFLRAHPEMRMSPFCNAVKPGRCGRPLSPARSLHFVCHTLQSLPKRGRRRTSFVILCKVCQVGQDGHDVGWRMSFRKSAGGMISAASAACRQGSISGISILNRRALITTR